MEEIEDILMEQKPDRRLLPNVPDPEMQRSNSDRRGANADDIVDKVQKQKQNKCLMKIKLLY